MPRADLLAAEDGIARERVVRIGRVSVLRYFRPGPDRAAPLVVFLPGGGHLARVAYGHPGGVRHDFLDSWLADAGFGLLALSYACDPRDRVALLADLSIDEWAGVAAQAAADVLDRLEGPRIVVLLAWSMAARAAGLFAAAARQRDIAIAAFMPMAASPPLPGLSSADPGTELVTAGIWNVHDSPVRGVPRGDAWLAELAERAARYGRPVIEPAIYRARYRVGTPAGLMPGREPAAASDLADFPLAAPISPRDPADYRHALCDAAIWGFVNALVIRRCWAEPALARALPAAAQWDRLLALMAALPQRLGRHVAGGHLFFIGEDGARATARAVIELLAETRAVTAELQDLLGGRGDAIGGSLSQCTTISR